MIDQLVNIDTEIFLWFNSRHAPFWDVVMMMASGKIIWIGMYSALIYALWRAYGLRVTIIAVIAAAVAVTLADQVTASLLRPYFGRLRPANPENPISDMVHIVNGYRSGRFGFPSSHAANTFALATLMSMIFKRKGFTLFMFFWALLNCYSRVYLGVHYPGDLLFGLTIGTFIGFMVYNFTRLIFSHWHLRPDEGQRNRLLNARLGSIRFRYRPAEVPVFVGCLTVVYMLFCAVAIFF